MAVESVSAFEQRAIAGGAMLFDPQWLPNADEGVFDPLRWQQASRESNRGGRGAVWFVAGWPGDHDSTHAVSAAVLRHYHRGGLMARLLGDRYLWRGLTQSRPFAEFRLLQTLHRRGLPVPRPLAARVQRHGVFARGDILTERITGARSLAQRLPQVLDDLACWQKVGACIGQLQAASLFHADLNAHNILFDADDACWIIDLDRGQLLRPAAGWQDANLSRLHRSLAKLGAHEHDGFDVAWASLVQACQSARRGVT